MLGYLFILKIINLTRDFYVCINTSILVCYRSLFKGSVIWFLLCLLKSERYLLRAHWGTCRWSSSLSEGWADGFISSHLWICKTEPSSRRDFVASAAEQRVPGSSDWAGAVRAPWEGQLELLVPCTVTLVYKWSCLWRFHTILFVKWINTHLYTVLVLWCVQRLWLDFYKVVVLRQPSQVSLSRLVRSPGA